MMGIVMACLLFNRSKYALSSAFYEAYFIISTFAIYFSVPYLS